MTNDGNYIDASIFRHMKLVHNAAIGERMARKIRIAIDSTVTDESTIAIRGRDMTSALPTEYTLKLGEMREAARRGR